MKRKIFFITVFLLTFFVAKSVLAKDGTPIIIYSLNGVSDNITVNPVINPVQIGFVSDENIENWVSIKIEKNDSSVHKYFYPSESFCDGKATCSEIWDGHLSDGTIAGDGIYNVIVKIKSETAPTYDISLTSLYTITVDTSVLKPTLSNITIATPANKLSYTLGELLDISGLVVIGTYDDASTNIETITTANISGFDSTTPAVGQILTITVGEKTATYAININAVPTIPTENIIIRNGDTVIYNGVITLPNTGTIDIADDTGVIHSVNADSVLGVIYLLSQTTESAFSLSDLQYYNSMGFIIKCITPKDQSQLCSNWQYVVNGTAPWDSVDSKVLSGGETIGIYFGYPYQVTFNTTSITTGGSFTATAQKYNSTEDTWSILSEVTIDVTVPNPDDPWSPTVVTSLAVDSNGNATFTLLNAGTYNVDISDNFGNFYYIPTYTVTVNTASSGGGGGSGDNSQNNFSIEDALSFLSSHQESDGSFSSPMYTDWVAIAAGAGDNSNLKSKIYDYLKNNPLDSSIITDNERHAMALMSLGINPYSETDINYIKKITDSFDGTQIGDRSLDNDDIFALIVLANAGYSSSDEIISEDVKYLLNPSKQPSNGFWGSIDMTSAVIQALRGFEDITGVSDVISKAENYLISNQESDNGFGNSFSTSWVLQSLFNNNQILKAENYLVLKQQTDGGMENINDDMDTRIWSTSYTIPAILHKSWKSIMQSFEKPVIQNNSSASVSENTNSQTSNNPVVCPRGDLFSTITGQACTTTDETNIITINTPINNQHLDLVKKIEDKKIIEVPKIKDIRKSDLLKISESPASEISVKNNLSASVENATPIEISVKKISQIVINSVIDILTYIGKGFCNLIIFLFSF